MTPNDLARLSPEAFRAFIIAYFESREYTLEGCRPTPAGELLFFQLDGTWHVAYILPNPPLMGRIWDVTSMEVACCITEAKNLTAACGYVITRSRFSFGARIEAIGSGIDIYLVDGNILQRWILSKKE